MTCVTPGFWWVHVARLKILHVIMEMMFYINVRENRMGNKEWTNPEKTKGAIKNG
jgi:hypothetical protein